VAAAALVLALAATVVFALANRQSEEPRFAPPEPATLDAYWRGDARWTLVHKWTTGLLGQERPYDGAHVEVVGDTWYLFDRRRYPQPCPNGTERMGVQVRESDDRGRTWSDPVPVIEPSPGTEWACAATDGDAFYDADDERWRYLFQCLDDSTQDADGDWNGCYVERDDESPLGRFEPVEDAPNPVIHSGELWRAICDPGDDCARPAGAHPVEDEGTFNVFAFDGSDYWIGFHGFDGVDGYRGIGKTPNFAGGSYLVDDAAPGLPTDSVFDASDAASFREQWIGAPVGAGAGSIVAEDGMYYALTEFPDVNLNCTAGQNWNVGIFRSPTLTSTHWEQYPAGNPIIMSSRTAEANGVSSACNVLYPGLFRDAETGAWYLMHGRSTPDPRFDAIYVYRLETDSSLLVNGDFWRSDAIGWVTPDGSSTNLSIHRDPNGSPDGTPYLAFNCGAPSCTPETSVLQNVSVGGGNDRAIEFGGTFRAEGEGTAELVVHQLDAGGKTLRSDVVPIRAGPTYARVRGTATLDPGARTLRYQLYPQTPNTFAADNLFLRVTG
jgi:hypothetical protein